MNFIKYISISLFILITSGIINAQEKYKVDIKSEDLKKPNQRTLFTGFDNHLTITTENDNAANFTLAVTDGEVSGTDHHKTVRVNNAGKISVYIISNNPEADTIRKVVFWAESVPLPVPVLDSLQGGEITAKEIFRTGPLKMINKSDLKELPKYEIVGFTVSVFTGMGFEYHKSTSDRFTPEQLSSIFNMKTGEKFLIQNIIARNEKQEEVDLGTISFKIKAE